MLGEELKQFLRKATLAIAGLLTGVGLTLVLTEYPGVLELRVNAKESYLKVDGSRSCEVMTEPVKKTN